MRMREEEEEEGKKGQTLYRAADTERVPTLFELRDIHPTTIAMYTPVSIQSKCSESMEGTHRDNKDNSAKQ